MNTFEDALDEYLHLLARVCPWDLPREEPLLTAFCEWLGAGRSGGAELDALGARDADAFADHARLAQDRYEALLAALAGVYRWAVRDGRVVDNPFTGAFELSRAARRSLPAPAAAPA